MDRVPAKAREAPDGSRHAVLPREAWGIWHGLIWSAWVSWSTALRGLHTHASRSHAPHLFCTEPRAIPTKRVPQSVLRKMDLALVEHCPLPLPAPQDPQPSPPMRCEPASLAPGQGCYIGARSGLILTTEKPSVAPQQLQPRGHGALREPAPSVEPAVPPCRLPGMQPFQGMACQGRNGRPRCRGNPCRAAGLILLAFGEGDPGGKPGLRPCPPGQGHGAEGAARKGRGAAGSGRPCPGGHMCPGCVWNPFAAAGSGVFPAGM